MEKEKIELIQIEMLTEKERNSVDAFLLSPNTNGEFINSLGYLAYHPRERFTEDSVVVRDVASKTVRGVMLATIDPENPKRVVSHMGTTFAGPILDQKLSIEGIETVLDLLMNYYEQRYEEIILKTTPPCYTAQPFDSIGYFLLRRGYTFGMTALANVIDLTQLHTEVDILQLFDAKKRNHTKKALKNESFIFGTSPCIRSEVWDQMNENLYHKFNSKTTHTYEEICDLARRVPERIQAFYVDTSDGDYGAFALVYKFKNVYHTQYLDTNYHYTGEYPNLLLVLRLIEQAMKEGYRYFSFGASTEAGGNIMNTGLYNYKSGYGGGDILLPKYTWRKKA